MINQKRIFLVLFTLILCIGSDQVTKEIIRLHLSRTKPLVLMTGISLDYVENKGAVFSFE